MGKPHCVRASSDPAGYELCQLLIYWTAVRTVKGMQKPTASAFTVAEASIILVINSTGVIAIAKRHKAKR